MALSSGEMKDIFFEAVKAEALTGSAPAAALRRVFLRMKDTMSARGATAQELDAFKRKIEAAIDAYPWRSTDAHQQKAARDALKSAFEGTVWDDKVSIINGLFLGAVKFE